MLLTIALSICSATNPIIDIAIDARNKGVEEIRIKEFVRQHYSGETEVRGLGIVNVVYSLPKNSDSFLVRQHISLTCDNEEVLHGNQHPYKRARGGAGSRSRHEQHRGIGSDE